MRSGSSTFSGLRLKEADSDSFKIFIEDATVSIGGGVEEHSFKKTFGDVDQEGLYSAIFDNPRTGEALDTAYKDLLEDGLPINFWDQGVFLVTDCLEVPLNTEAKTDSIRDFVNEFGWEMFAPSFTFEWDFGNGPVEVQLFDVELSFQEGGHINMLSMKELVSAQVPVGAFERTVVQTLESLRRGKVQASGWSRDENGLLVDKVTIDTDSASYEFDLAFNEDRGEAAIKWEFASSRFQSLESQLEDVKKFIQESWARYEG